MYCILVVALFLTKNLGRVPDMSSVDTIPHSHTGRSPTRLRCVEGETLGDVARLNVCVVDVLKLSSIRCVMQFDLRLELMVCQRFLAVYVGARESHRSLGSWCGEIYKYKGFIASSYTRNLTVNIVASSQVRLT